MFVFKNKQTNKKKCLYLERGCDTGPLLSISHPAHLSQLMGIQVTRRTWLLKAFFKQSLKAPLNLKPGIARIFSKHQLEF